MTFRQMASAAVILAGFVRPIIAQVEDTVAIQKVAILHLMNEKAFHSTGPIKAVCLSAGTARPPIKGIQIPLVNYADPAASLVKKLAGSTYPIVPGTRCQADPSRGFAIVDSASRPKRTAMAIIFSPVRISQDGIATLLIERAFDTKNVIGFLCMLVRSGATWKLQKCEVTWDHLG